MLTSCLIFLCIGVFAHCRPMTELQLKTLNEEIQHTLTSIIKDPIQAVTMSPSNMMAPVLIPKDQKQCPTLTLEAYIKLLNLSNIEDHEGMNVIRKYLQHFANNWALQHKRSDQKCETNEYPHRGFKQVLIDLKHFMKKLYCMQENCN